MTPSYADMKVEPVREERTGLGKLQIELEAAARAVLAHPSLPPHEALERAVRALDEYDLTRARSKLRSHLWGDLRRALTAKLHATLRPIDPPAARCAKTWGCSRKGGWEFDGFDGPSGPRCKQHAEKLIERQVEDAMRESTGKLYGGGAPDDIADTVKLYGPLGVDVPELPEWAL